MNYKEFEIQLSGESPNHYIAKAMDNGNAIEAQTFELRTGELKVIEGLQRLEEKAVTSSKKETFHIEFGKELYNKVFTGKLGEYFKNCLEEAQNNDMGLRICLRFYENAQEIAVLPWEFLHDGSDFLVTSRNTLISRLPSRIIKIKKDPLESILRMLVVISSPDDPRVAPLNTELEQEVILEAVDKLQRDHKMEVDFTEDATFETISGYLNEKDYHIVHFTGHGIFNEEKGKGYLVLETVDGKARMVDNTSISDLLEGRGVRLVVLSACQSGKTSNKEAYADLASILARNKIPAVAAMQYSIFDISATKFASIFYQAIAYGKPVDLALTETRIAMKNTEKSNGVDFATPILYLCDPDCLAVGKIKPEASELFNKPTMLGDVAILKKGFVGRRKELRILQKDFMSDVKRAAIIYGFGGLGKTVLATRLALRMNQHFDGMFGMKCSATTKPEEILNRLNAFLLVAGIQQLNEVLYQPVPLEAKTAMLVNILNQKRFLIILDNFEDCLDEERSNIANHELKVFIQHLLNNTISNSKFIITSRYNFDPLEGRLTGAIDHISLSEMPFPETVWLMNNYKELADLGMDKKHNIYKAIGGHPWTLGQFMKHAAIETVDNVLLDLSKVKQELINFTLLDKSYSKLDEKARRLFLHASIYQNPVPIEGLEWIVGDESQPSPSIGDTLELLINWGLISREQQGDETLYAMHTLVRDFAKQVSEKEGLERKKLLVRAAQHYENLAAATHGLWTHLEARDYYYQAEEWERANDIVQNAFEFLVRLGHMELAMNLLNQSIETTSSIKKAVALGNLAEIYYFLGDWEMALKVFTKVKDMFEEEGDKINIGASLHELGKIHANQGNYEEAMKLFQQSLEIDIDLGDKNGMAETLRSLGALHYFQNNYKEAEKLFQQSLKIEDGLEDQMGIASCLHNLGNILYVQGDYKGSGKLYQQSLKINEELGNKSGIASTLHQLGIINQKLGNYQEAAKLYQRSLEIEKKLGDKSGIAQTLHQLGNIHQEQGNYQEAGKLYQQSLEIAKELGDKSGIAISLAQLGRIHEENDKNFPDALEKYLIALSIFKQLNAPESKIVESNIAGLKEKMGEEAFNKAFEEIRGKHDT
ncbi:MAG: tetratricopeptide repeat protein [Candidatus Methanoperedens sp.]